MIEMKSAEEGGGNVPLNANDNTTENESFFKRRKMYIIFGLAILLIIILIIVLSVCLTGSSTNSDNPNDSDAPDTPTDTPPEIIINYKNNITLNVYSDSDDEEISFFSDEFDFDEILNMNGDKIMLIDDKKYLFNKSMKLKVIAEIQIICLVDVLILHRLI